MGRRPAAQAHSFSVALSCRENGPIKHDKGGKGLGKEGTGAVRLLTVPGRAGPGDPGGRAHDVGCADRFKEGNRRMFLELGLPEADPKDKHAHFSMLLPCVCVSLPFLSLLPWEQAAAVCFRLPVEA